MPGDRRHIFDLVGARYFLAIAEERHFTRAARRLGVSQQTVSGAIGRLEQALGVGLFERTSRTVELTERGEVLLPLVRELVDTARRLDQTAGMLKARGPESVRIGYTETTGYDVVPTVLEALRTRWPDLDVQAQELWASQLTSQLRDGSIDIGFGRCLRSEDALLIAPVRADSLALVVLESHPLARRPSVVLGDLAGERLVMFPRELAPGLHDAILAAVTTAGVDVSVVASRMLGGGGIRSRLQAVGGVELCSRSRMRHRVAGVTMVPVDAEATLTVDLAWSSRASEATRRIVQFVRQLSKERGWDDPETDTAVSIQVSAPRD